MKILSRNILLTLLIGLLYSCSTPTPRSILVIGLTGATDHLSLRDYLNSEPYTAKQEPVYSSLVQNKHTFHLYEYNNDQTILSQLQSDEQRPAAIILAVDAMNGIHEEHIHALHLAKEKKIPLLAVLTLRFSVLHNSPYQQLVTLEIRQVLADTGYNGTPLYELQANLIGANQSFLRPLLNKIDHQPEP